MYVKIVTPRGYGDGTEPFTLVECDRARVEKVDGGDVILDLESDREHGTSVRLVVVPQNSYYFMNNDGKTIDRFNGMDFAAA